MGEDSRFAVYQQAYDSITQACDKHGRNPDSLTKSVGLGICLEGGIPNPGETVLTGSHSEVADQLGQFLEADVDQVMVSLYPNTPKGLDSLAKVLDEFD